MTCSNVNFTFHFIKDIQLLKRFVVLTVVILKITVLRVLPGLWPVLSSPFR